MRTAFLPGLANLAHGRPSFEAAQAIATLFAQGIATVDELRASVADDVYALVLSLCGRAV